jgi:cytochrome c oxidase subunit 4
MSSPNPGHAAHADSHGSHSVHVLPWQLLVGVWALLMGLTVLTVWQWSLDLGKIDLVIAMVIATIKALLVAMIFMHLAWDRPFNGIVFLSSLIFAGLFVSVSLLDTDQNQAAIAKRRVDKSLVGARPDYAAIQAEHAKHVGHGAADHGAAGHGSSGHEAQPESQPAPASDH